MIRPLVPVLAALALAACNQGGAPEQGNSVEAAKLAEATAAAQKFGDRIRALPEGQRRGVFLRAIRDGQQDCQEVTGDYEAAPMEGRPTWVATCDKRTPWTLSFRGDGVAIVSEMSAASRLPPKAS